MFANMTTVPLAGSASICGAFAANQSAPAGNQLTFIVVHEAGGVRLAGGDEIGAERAVVCGAGHWQLVDHLVPREDWGSDADSARR